MIQPLVSSAQIVEVCAEQRKFVVVVALGTRASSQVLLYYLTFKGCNNLSFCGEASAVAPTVMWLGRPRALQVQIRVHKLTESENNGLQKLVQRVFDHLTRYPSLNLNGKAKSIVSVPIISYKSSPSSLPSSTLLETKRPEQNKHENTHQKAKDKGSLLLTEPSKECLQFH